MKKLKLTMFRNYLVIIIRNLLKHKLFSFINIFGLSLAITISILVILFVKNELTFDRFFDHSDRIYRPYTHARAGDREAINVNTPFIMGKQLQENYPEVEAYTILTQFNDNVTALGNTFNETIHIGSGNFFRIFDFPVRSGITEEVLKDPESLVITRSIAEKYFGRLDVTGEVMTIQLSGIEKDFIVRAVLEDMPANSSIRFDMMIGDHHLGELFPEPMLTSWNMITGETYILLREGSDPSAVEPKFASLVQQVMGEDLEEMSFDIHLQPLTDIHLNTDLPAGDVPVSDPKYMVILVSIALLILVIASINFIMLSLGRSFMRAREIGIRKSNGASRFQLMMQFLGESTAIAFLGLLVGVGMVYLALPWFNDFTNQNLQFSFTLFNTGVFLLLTLLTGLLAGLYPAFVLSGFKPVRILRGELRMHRSNNLLGTFLVTGQFILFIILIGCTLIFRGQLNYLQNKDLGFNKEHIMLVPMNIGDAKGVREAIHEGFKQAARLEKRIQGLPAISSAGITSHTFEPGRWTEIGYENADRETRTFYYNTVNAGYLPTLDIRLIRGRNFNQDSPSDQKRAVIVNESFVREFDLGNGLGERIPHDEFEDNEIIGIVEDFHIHSLHAEIPPLMLAMDPVIAFSGAHNINIGSSIRPKLMLRLQYDQLEDGIRAVEEAFHEVFPDDLFSYEFVDENLKMQYEQEKNLGRVVTSASVLAVIIGCLGLFGLSVLAFNSRIKEISIRKVFGAPSLHLLVILAKRFVYLLGIALIVSIPFTVKIMQQWLNEFEYRIPIQPSYFLVAGLISLFIVLVTLSYQGLQTIRTNPAETLRNE